MKSVNDDMKMSAVDIFNIIASPSISFLSQDATELGRLILNYGIPKTTEDDVERGGEKGATSVSKIEPIASVETDQLNPTTPGVKKRNMADVIAAKLVGKQESRPKNSNPLSSQFEMEKHRKVEARMKKALAKELNERYDKTFMPKKSRSELKHTLKVTHLQCSFAVVKSNIEKIETNKTTLTSSHNKIKSTWSKRIAWLVLKEICTFHCFLVMFGLWIAYPLNYQYHE